MRSCGGRRLAPAMLFAVAGALGACTGVGPGASADDPCLDDSEACVKQRTALVEAMIADPQRNWIGQPVSRTTVASGIRLFAYQNVMESLSCPQLGAGVQEMRAALQSLSQGRLGGQSAERHNQVKALTEDVHARLQQMARQRGCKA